MADIKETTTISVLSGNETIPGALRSASLSVLASDQRTRASFLYAGPSLQASVSAGRNLRKEVGGELFNSAYAVPDGDVLIVKAALTISGIARNKKVALIVDHRAPYNRLQVSTSRHERSVAQHLHIEGRFWLMNETEAAEKYGYSLDWFNRQTVFDALEQLHPGAAMPVLEKQTLVINGEEKNVTVTRPKRALRI